MKKLMVKIKSNWSEVYTQAEYRVTRVNGHSEVYRLTGLVNTNLGMPSFMLRHPHGFTSYVRLDDVAELEKVS